MASDGQQEAVSPLIAVRRCAEAHAITDHANGRDNRQWLDALALIDQAERKVAAHVRTAKAEALREAADEFAVIPHPYEGGVTAWLRDRADKETAR